MMLFKSQKTFGIAFSQFLVNSVDPTKDKTQ